MAKAKVFCEHCGGNDENPQDHCMDCTRPPTLAELRDVIAGLVAPRLGTRGSKQAQVAAARDAARAMLARLDALGVKGLGDAQR